MTALSPARRGLLRAMAADCRTAAAKLDQAADGNGDMTPAIKTLENLLGRVMLAAAEDAPPGAWSL